MKEDKSQVNDRKETNNERAIEIWYKWIGSVCKVRTQDCWQVNFSLVTVHQKWIMLADQFLTPGRSCSSL